GIVWRIVDVDRESPLTDIKPPRSVDIVHKQGMTSIENIGVPTFLPPLCTEDYAALANRCFDLPPVLSGKCEYCSALESILGRPCCLSSSPNVLSRISAAIERPSTLRIAFCSLRTLPRIVESPSTRLIAVTKFSGEAWSGEMTTPTFLFVILAATPG